MTNNLPHNKRKVLVVGPAWVGDLVMTQTLFKLIKHLEPHTEITVLAPAWAEALLTRMPEVDHSLVSPFKHGELRARDRIAFGRGLRSRHYDQAIVIPNSWKSSLIPYAARIPKRTGWFGEWRWGLLNDARWLRKTKYPLMIQRLIALGLEPHAKLPESPTLPHLVTTPVSVAEALQTHGIAQPQQPVLALCPGAAFGPAKRWPTKYFSDVANQKLADGWQVWLFGSNAEKEMNADIQRRCAGKCVDLSGQTTLAEAIDLMSIATAVISNDSGLMHIAAALERPLVVIYGSSSPKFTPPLSQRVRILSLNLACSPCFKRTCPLGHTRCLNDLTPSMVLEGLGQLCAS